jgi:hypothetical protein
MMTHCTTVQYLSRHSYLATVKKPLEDFVHTLIKKKIKNFPHILGNSDGAVEKSYINFKS